MSSDVLVTKSELENKPTEAPKKKTKLLAIIWRAFLILIIIVSLCVLAFTFYLRTNYPDNVFVNGMSMYPTLNRDAKSLVVDNQYETFYKEGDKYDFNRTCKDGDLLDYGLLNSKKETFDTLKRFDIVTTYFPSDYQDGALIENTSMKIKRVVAFPGETVELRTDDTPMGVLLINGEVVEQPGNDLDRYNAPLKEAGINKEYLPSKDDPNSVNWANKPVTLGEDEYYILGDNRYGLYSRDSRSIGPIKKDNIQARLALVVGVCRVSDNGKNCNLQYSSLHWPWRFDK